ncbi:prosaposin-like [Chelmon rostratus]|uniref:prosaposin-like n=1 Tax=Chelmon rostratus TaxID=109905 RepID=UPI001BECF405|nr:prosaposin-like [Chelmon rostratus]XP_041816493.1 prosaposin-like [Chelmon rostratus]
MALLKMALLLFICLEGCALASAFNIDGLQNVPDALTENGDVCKDCTQIFELLADLLSNTDLQKKIMDSIESMCDHLPGSAAKLCKEEVEKMLPVAINFMTAIVKPAEVCKIIGLCGSCDKQEKMLRYFAKEAFQLAVTSENPTTQCSFCIFLVKTLEDLLPKERTEDAVIQLLEEICHILPSSYRDQCEAVIGKFGKTVLDAILSYATPQAICALIHLCKGQEAPLVDPCTLTTYRCRDIKTALRCGTLFYCQKYASKLLNYNAL